MCMIGCVRGWGGFAEGPAGVWSRRIRGVLRVRAARERDFLLGGWQACICMCARKGMDAAGGRTVQFGGAGGVGARWRALRVGGM